MAKQVDACQTTSDLASDQAGGRILTDAERALVEDHLRECAPCRLERAAAAILAHTGDSGPAAPMDELGRRRFVGEAVRQALADRQGEHLPSLAVRPTPGRHKRILPWVALAAGLAGLGVGLGLTWSGAGKDVASRLLPSPERPSAQLVLSEGVVLFNGAPAEVGHSIEEGQAIRATGGRAAVGLPDDALVMLEEGAALRVSSLGISRTELYLQNGEILVSVTPRRHRRPFVVGTVAGRVEVVGTVFSLSAAGSRVSVRVLRGQVRVSCPGLGPLSVSRGQAASLGAGAPRALTSEEETRDLETAGTLGLLGSGDRALASIHSRPTGARVEVDGLLLGRTPLEVSLRPGHPLLTVSLAGRSPVQERLTVAAGDRIRRDYELSQAVADSGGMEGATRPAPEEAMEACDGKPPVEMLVAVPPKPGQSGDRGEATAPEPERPTAPSARPEPERPTAPSVRPEPAVPNAQTLLAQARRHRTAKSWPGAAKAYQAILRHHSASAEAQAARVALGLLLLDQLGDPQGALSHLEAYLAKTRRGALAQEAAYGRIRALGRLGRVVAEKEALDAFLHYYPGALQEPAVRRRLKALSDAASSGQARPGGAR